jgi:hypothetical protein
MSKKRTSSRKPAPAKKAVTAPKVIKAKNGGTRPSNPNGGKTASPAPATKPLPVVATQQSKLQVPLWARMPLAIMDFWFSRPERGHGKS